MGINKLTKDVLANLMARVRDIYLSDDIPWVVGYSGGKDSTATLQLVWQSISELPAEQRRKTIHVISTDTLVEQPVVAAWVNKSLQLMTQEAEKQGLPIEAHRLTPQVKNSFWVNLIGRGYPAPRRNFRWCTDRLKIEPSNRFIRQMVDKHGEAIVVLGTRKAESQQRAAVMEAHEQKRVRDWLSPNASLPNSLVFTPIEDWSNDQVWYYLMQVRNPWGVSNKDLMAMYRGASADNECPLVIDTSTPSCGTSRFGCWVCTVVSADKSMEAMIENDWEKAWLTPLLELRNELAPLNNNGVLDDVDRRDFRRMSGRVQLDKKGRAIHGPYTKEWREHWLRRVLALELEIQATAPLDMGEIRLISDEELREIRRIWVEVKHEFDDQVPAIYREVTGKPYPYVADLAPGPFGQEEWALLEELSDGDAIFMELQASMLDLKQRSRGLSARRAIVDELNSLIEQARYSTRSEAEVEERKRAARRGIEFNPPQHETDEIAEEEGLELA